jgi:hypothetical protein
MKLLLSTLLAAALTLSAADVTGTWVGSFVVTGEENGRKRPAHLVLKQEGSKLTGTAGPDASEQEPILNGRVEENTVSFQVEHGEHVMTFRLKHDQDTIAGQMSREVNGAKQTAELTVQRQK